MGNTKKLMEASMALLQGTPGGQLNIVALNKGLFYLDLYALRDLGHTVTDETYVALQQGPVIENYQKTLVGELVRAGLAEQICVGQAKPVRVLKRIEKFELLTDSERDIARAIGTHFSSRTSTLLSDMSHGNRGWELARAKGGHGVPINMLIAMQQITDDDDPWLGAAPDTQMSAELDQAHLAHQRWE